jgi:hypothetical protein
MIYNKCFDQFWIMCVQFQPTCWVEILQLWKSRFIMLNVQRKFKLLHKWPAKYLIHFVITQIWNKWEKKNYHEYYSIGFWQVFNPLRMKVYFYHHNQNAKNICNFTTLLKPHNIGTHLKGIETSFQVVSLFFKSFHVWGSYIIFWNFLKIPSVLKGLNTCIVSVGLVRHTC